MNIKQKNVRLAKMAMLVAISIVLVMIIHFPIFPAVAFLEYDPADIPILIGTFALAGSGNTAYRDNIFDTGFYREYGKRSLRNNNAYIGDFCARYGGGNNI